VKEDHQRKLLLGGLIGGGEVEHVVERQAGGREQTGTGSLSGHGGSPFHSVCMEVDEVSNWGLSKRYKIRRYKIQDIETAVAVWVFTYLVSLYLVSLYLTVKLQFTKSYNQRFFL
jgi:hypothetical protein